MAKKTLSDLQKKALKAAKAATSGCPLMEDRTKADNDEFEGMPLTIIDAYPMNGDNGVYFCVICAEADDLFFLSGGGLTNALKAVYDVCDNDLDLFREAVVDMVFTFGKKRKTKNGRMFRPVSFDE